MKIEEIAFINLPELFQEVDDVSIFLQLLRLVIRCRGDERG